MNGHSRTIRAILSGMGPVRAEEYIRAFDLHEDEASYIIEREAKKNNANTVDFYADMARAFLDDEDVQADKLSRYWKYVAAPSDSVHAG